MEKATKPFWYFGEGAWIVGIALSMTWNCWKIQDGFLVTIVLNKVVTNVSIIFID